MPSTYGDSSVRLTAWVHGHVQRVGFRWWTRCRALELGLVGVARNMPNGVVVVTAEGEKSACNGLLAALKGESTPGRVDHVVDQWTEARGGLHGFVEA